VGFLQFLEAALEIPQRGSHLQGIDGKPIDLFEVFKSRFEIIPG